METQTAIPVTYAKPVSVAFLLGASDAEAQEICCPEMYFARYEDKVKYCEGYLSVSRTHGAALTAQYFGAEVTK